MGNPAKFDRCVKKVKGKSRGRVNAYAVCTAAGMRNPSKVGDLSKLLDGTHVMEPENGLKAYHAAREARDAGRVRDSYARVAKVKSALKNFRVMVSPGTDGTVRVFRPDTQQEFFIGTPLKSNPEPDSADMYESFHGAPSEEILEFHEQEHYHGNLAGLGILVELKLVTITGYDVTLSFSDPDSLVAANPGLWQRLKSIGSRTTLHHVPKRSAKMVSKVTHKGFTVYKAQEGGYRVPQLDPESSFDTPGHAKKFIDQWVKQNPAPKETPDAFKAGYRYYHSRVKSSKGSFNVGSGAETYSQKFGMRTMSPLGQNENTKARIKSAQEAYEQFLDGTDFAHNERLKAQHGENPGPVQTSLKYLSKAGSAALKPFDSTFGKMGKYLDNKVGRALKGKKKNPSMDPALLCSNEDGTQLYIVGGDQSVDLKSIHMENVRVKDSMVLGEAYFVSYFTQKDFDDMKPTIYEHSLSEETDKKQKHLGYGSGIYPTVRYDYLNQKLHLDGGTYFIEKPLLSTSPGIQD